jgi:hypothetical protein
VLSAIGAPLKVFSDAESIRSFTAEQPVTVFGFGEVPALQDVSAADQDLVYALGSGPAAKGALAE